MSDAILVNSGNRVIISQIHHPFFSQISPTTKRVAAFVAFLIAMGALGSGAYLSSLSGTSTALYSSLIVMSVVALIASIILFRSSNQKESGSKAKPITQTNHDYWKGINVESSECVTKDHSILALGQINLESAFDRIYFYQARSSISWPIFGSGGSLSLPDESQKALFVVVPCDQEVEKSYEVKKNFLTGRSGQENEFFKEKNAANRMYFMTYDEAQDFFNKHQISLELMRLITLGKE